MRRWQRGKLHGRQSEEPVLVTGSFFPGFAAVGLMSHTSGTRRSPVCTDFRRIPARARNAAASRASHSLILQRHTQGGEA